ncbi:MAG: hypothetical protein Kow0022_09180 [Phycisphaerales bacterium]
MLLAVLVVLVLSLGAIVALTRGPIARRIVGDQIRSMIEGQVEIGSARLGLSGQVLVRDIRIRAIGVDGPAGEVLFADSAQLSLSGLWRGRPGIAKVRIEHPVVRVSQNRQTGELNVMPLRFRSGGGGANTLPIVEVEGGLIELGEHDGGRFELLHSLPMRGMLSPGHERGSYEFGVQLTGEGGEAARLSGTMTEQELVVHVSELDLAKWPNRAVPSRYRDLHASMNLKGRILPTRIAIPREGPMEITVRLRDGELDLPLDQTPAARGHMTDVNGELRIGAGGITATLTGLLDQVPARAELRAPSLDPRGQFTVTMHVDPVRLNENLHRLGYLPEFVREQLAIFSNPTATVQLDLVLSRQADSDEVQASGQFVLSDAVASFQGFPYEFRDMSGVFELAPDRLEFHDIRGTAATGARLQASGWVEPLTDQAEASVLVHVEHVPTDDTLRSGFSEQSRSLYDFLLDQQAARHLVDRGLIALPAQRQAWEDERQRLQDAIARGQADEQAGGRLAELERLLARPTFELGGQGTVDVAVYRYPGAESRWDTSIDVTLPKVGLISRHFPLPILAEGFRLRVFNGHATLEAGEFRGLQGGSARVEAEAWLDQPDRLPRLRIEASDVPVTSLLLEAIPGPRDDASNDMTDARILLEGLGLEGAVDCLALVGQDDAPEFDITVTPKAMTARPRPWHAASGQVVDGLRFDAIAGSIHVRPGRLSVDLDASLPSRVDRPGGVELHAVADFDEARASGVHVRELQLSLQSFDLTTPAEQLIGVLSEQTGEQLLHLRSRFDPAGLADAVVSLTDSADRPAVRLTLDHVRDASAAALGARLTMPDAAGTITVERGTGMAVRFEHFGGDTLFDGSPVGDVRLDGTLTLADDSASGQVHVGVRGGRFESAIIPRLLADRARGLAEWFSAAEPAGSFDFDARAALTDTGSVQVIEAQLHPRSFALTHNAQRLEFANVEGKVVLAEDTGRLEGLSLSGDALSVRAEGVFSIDASDVFDVQLGYELHAPSLTGPLRALLPPALDQALESLRFDASGPVSLREGQLLIARRAEGVQIDALGRVQIERARAEIGVGLDEVDAAITFVAHLHPLLQTPDFELELRSDSLRAAGVWLKDVFCPIRSAGDGNGIEIGPWVATSHDGRIAGSAVAWTEPGDDRARFDLRVLLSGVRFAPVLADLALQTDEPDPDTAADRSRGVIDAQLTLYGVVDGPRRGTGTAQVSGGRVLKLPLLLPLLEVTSLQPPSGEKLDLATAQFYIQDDTVTFESLGVLSKSIELIGYGTMRLPDRTLDLRINSRARRRTIPLIGSMLAGLRDELLTTRIAGTLADPAISSEQFVGTRRAIAALLGREQTEQDRLLQDIKQRAMRYRDRSRLSGKAIQHVVQSLEQQQEENNQDP